MPITGMDTMVSSTNPHRTKRPMPHVPESSGHSRSSRPRMRSARRASTKEMRARNISMLLPLCCLAAILLIACIVVASSKTGSPMGEAEHDMQVGEQAIESPDEWMSLNAASFPSLENLDPLAFDALELEDGIHGFSLAPSDEAIPELDETNMKAISDAIEPYRESNAKASFLLMDIETGRGFACNIDNTIYAASSFKGPFSAFVCSEYLDSGKLDFDTVVACDTSSCPSGTSLDGKDTIYNLMESALLYSNNEAYAGMRGACSNSTLASWFASIGVRESKAYDMRMPFFTTRDMSKMWLAVYNYLESDGEHVAVLADLYGKTELSFIRSALEESEDSDVAVMDKGGWYRPDNPEYNAVIDCGIVTCNERDYLLCVMTGVRWTQGNVDLAQNLISAVFGSRGDLFLNASA